MVRSPARARLVALSGAFNFRDLGGYATADGRVTRWGRVFRSDAIDALTEEDLAIISGLGIATVLDLRSPAEVERAGVGPIHHSGALVRNAPVLRHEAREATGARSASGPGGGSERYLWYLDVGAAAIIEVLETVADESALPVVFHCTAGKDRTGVIAALLLACVGVGRAAIVADYMATQDALPRIFERLRGHPVYGPQLTTVAPAALSVDPRTMEAFLDGLAERHGGAGSWISARSSNDLVTRLRSCLLAETAR